MRTPPVTDRSQFTGELSDTVGAPISFRHPAHCVALTLEREPIMSEHVTVRISKPRITLYGVLVTAIIAWGAYSMFWRRPAALPHRPLLPSNPITVSTPDSLQRSTGCAFSGRAGSVGKTLAGAGGKSIAQVTREMRAVNGCARAAGPAPAAARPVIVRRARKPEAP